MTNELLSYLMTRSPKQHDDHVFTFYRNRYIAAMRPKARDRISDEQFDHDNEREFGWAT